MYQCTLLTKQTSEWCYTNEHKRILMILSKFLLCCECLRTVLQIKRTWKEHEDFFFPRCERLSWCILSCRLEHKNFFHCTAQISKSHHFCMSYHKKGGINKHFLITTTAWSILMEGNCGMQVTGFIIIHNNNIGCICTNVSALKRCQNIFPTFPRAFSTYSTELRHLYVSSPIYQATFPNNKKNSKLDAIFFTQTTYVNSSSPSRQWFGWCSE